MEWSDDGYDTANHMSMSHVWSKRSAQTRDMTPPTIWSGPRLSELFWRVTDAKLCTFDVPNPGWRHLFEEIPLRTFFEKTASECSSLLIRMTKSSRKLPKKWSGNCTFGRLGDLAHLGGRFLLGGGEMPQIAWECNFTKIKMQEYGYKRIRLYPYSRVFHLFCTFTGIYDFINIGSPWAQKSDFWQK